MTSDRARPPIWSAIAAALRAEIAEGARPPGDRLPTEAQLSARFGVNRHTVRRALAALSDEGLVHSRRGAGAFVTARPTDYPIGRRVRFHSSMAAAGRLPERRISSVETRTARPAETAALGLVDGAKVLVAEGISLADDRPIALFVSAFPAGSLPGLGEVLARTGSVTKALTAAGVPDYLRVSTRLTARLADAAQAALLEIAPGTALIRTESVNATPNGMAVEYGLTHFVGDRVTLTLEPS